MSAGRRLTISGLALAWCVVVALVGAPSAVRAQAVDDGTNAWLVVLDAYLAGDYRQSTVALDLVIAEAPQDAVRRALVQMRAAMDAATSEGATRTARRRLQAAALVPMEALLPLSARVADDHRFAFLEDALRQALTALRETGKTRGTRGSEWRLFLQWAELGYMQFLLNAGRLEEVERIAATLRLSKADADLQVQHDLLRGMVRERTGRLVTGGTLARHSYLAGDGTVGPMGPVADAAHVGGVTMRTDRLVLARRFWTSAARWYERVLEARPSDPEARLHLARTWLDRDQPRRALDLLQPLAVQPCVVAECPLALLFTGDAHERLAAVDDASRAYLQASGELVTRQSALLALLHLGQQRGSAPGLALARQLRDAAPLGREATPDAWGPYVGGRRANIDAILRPLRRAVQR
ncbi:MAG TPA: hypothetical protein VMF13_13725 [Luteitalea sp.]|nr:hypothetical protein [Luteitalea sp.]